MDAGSPARPSRETVRTCKSKRRWRLLFREERKNQVAGKFTGKSVSVAGGTGALGQAVTLSFLYESACCDISQAGGISDILTSPDFF
jgi:hypothetical protein